MVSVAPRGVRLLGFIVSTCLLPGCASRTSQAAIAPAATAATATFSRFRIVSPESVEEIPASRMFARLARADVVFIGEQHDDPETHRAEVELLAGVGRTGRPVVLSLEMFERDVQPVVDDYVAGRIGENDFLARSRPWDRYASDYRPLIMLAKENHWRVVAANVPRPLASAVGRKGMSALDTLSAADRQNAARENVCPRDDYHARFMESMRSHSPGSGQGDSLPTAMAERFYLAQCVKDETMAESIVNARRATTGDPIVVHFDGAFHSDYRQGTVARVRRREPGWTLVVLSAIPVADPSVSPIVMHSGKADFVIFTQSH